MNQNENRMHTHMCVYKYLSEWIFYRGLIRKEWKGGEAAVTGCQSLGSILHWYTITWGYKTLTVPRVPRVMSGA